MQKEIDTDLFFNKGFPTHLSVDVSVLTEMDLKSILCLTLWVLHSAGAKPSLPDSSPEEFPFHALVKGVITCNGILISKNYVITPACCVYGSTKASIFLGFKGYPYFLINHAESHKQILYSEEIIIHEDYAKLSDDRHLNNIALIKLQNPARLSAHVQPAKLIEVEDNPMLMETDVHITGWIRSTNTNLKVGKVKLRNRDTCGFLFGNSFLENQEGCVKWPNEAHLNVIGNPVSLNGKIFGYQTNTPSCVHAGTTCSQNDMILILIPYLEWIQCRIGTDQSKHDKILFKEKVEQLHRALKEVGEQAAKLDGKVEVLSNQFEEKKKQDSNYALKINEQFGDTKTEISNTEIRQNSSIFKLREEFGNARTEIFNSITAQRNETNLLGRRVSVLETENTTRQLIEKLQIDVLNIENRTTIIKLAVDYLNHTLQQQNNKFSESIHELAVKNTLNELAFQIGEKTVEASLHNITDLIYNKTEESKHRINELSETVHKIIKKSEHTWHEQHNFPGKSEEEVLKLADRLGFLEHKFDFLKTNLHDVISHLNATIYKYCMFDYDGPVPER